MSYDLHLKARTGDLNVDTVIRYFTTREHYRFEQRQFFYYNELTGVYFYIDLNEPVRDESDEDSHYPLSFNINFFRPSFFILEAECELTPFIREFDLVVDDPQVDGMGIGEYNPELLISGWNAGNEVTYGAFLGESPLESWKVLPYPKHELLRTWNWNYHRQLHQTELGDSIFAAKVFYMNFNGTVKTVNVWPDGIPIASLEVDYLRVRRDRLAPRSWFKKKPDELLLPFSELAANFGEFIVREAGGTYRTNYEETPPRLERFLRALPARPTHRLIDADSLVEQELVDRYSVVHTT